MAIPGECHKHITQNEQEDSINSVYHISKLQNRCKGSAIIAKYQTFFIFFIAQFGKFVHKKVDFVHFILLCAQKVVPLRPIFKPQGLGYTLLIIYLWL